MTLPIETSTRCNCGTHVELQQLPPFARDARWQASCPRCLDPVEDAGERDKIVGVGTTTEEALWDWQVSHDEAWEVEWRPVTTVIDLEQQVAEESARQRGWFERLTDRRHFSVDGLLYGPPRAAGVESND
ncbi:MAG TPA: hypothetical protein VIU86_20135 [Gaiellaceae bacterium]